MKQIRVWVLLIVLISIGVVSAQSDAFANGTWESNGYGLILHTEGGAVSLLEVTSVSCIPSVYQSALDAGDFGVTQEGDQLVITNPYTLYVSADPIDTLPTQCADGGTPASDDPELNFEVFWHTFDEQYAHFERRGVDWQAAYDEYRPQVTPDTTPEALFAILSAMIAPLEDGHVNLETPFDSYSSFEVPEWASSPMAFVMTYLDAMTAAGVNRVGGDISFDLNEGILVGDEAMIASPYIFFGDIQDGVGYVQILAMEDTGGGLEEVAAAIDRVMAAFADDQAVIVDVRFNGGGEDAIALLLASRFADQERFAYDKAARDGDMFTPVREFFVTPGGERQFTGQTYLLTSRFTASAAEMFTMAMGVLPHVTIIGDSTEGIHSDALGRSLPNGWTFSLSNEVYRAADGEVYEALGMPPDIVIPFAIPNIAEGQDAALDAALVLIDG